MLGKRVEAGTTEIKNRTATLGADGGVGPVGYSVGAKALGVLSLDDQQLLYQGLRAIAGQQALLGLLLQRAPTREDLLAGLLGRLVTRCADAKLLRAGGAEVPFAVRVGVVRYAVGAHAHRVGDRRRRPRRSPGGCGTARRCRAAAAARRECQTCRGDHPAESETQFARRRRCGNAVHRSSHPIRIGTVPPATRSHSGILDVTFAECVYWWLSPAALTGKRGRRRARSAGRASSARRGRACIGRTPAVRSAPVAPAPAGSRRPPRTVENLVRTTRRSGAGAGRLAGPPGTGRRPPRDSRHWSWADVRCYQGRDSSAPRASACRPSTRLPTWRSLMPLQAMGGRRTGGCWQCRPPQQGQARPRPQFALRGAVASAWPAPLDMVGVAVACPF